MPRPPIWHPSTLCASCHVRSPAHAPTCQVVRLQALTLPPTTSPLLRLGIVLGSLGVFAGLTWGLHWVGWL